MQLCSQCSDQAGEMVGCCCINLGNIGFESEPMETRMWTEVTRWAAFGPYETREDSKLQSVGQWDL